VRAFVPCVDLQLIPFAIVLPGACPARAGDARIAQG
jgi:hypothetical protein